ncbi:MAG: hypothetical protein ABI600_19185 [Luteolibacter sp.]
MQLSIILPTSASTMIALGVKDGVCGKEAPIPIAFSPKTEVG